MPVQAAAVCIWNISASLTATAVLCAGATHEGPALNDLAAHIDSADVLVTPMGLCTALGVNGFNFRTESLNGIQ